jgi:Ca2+-binding RTX toxin-like protein
MPQGNTIHGTAGDDFIVGTEGDDFVLGSEGNDEIWGQGGNDTLVGGEGNDTLSDGAGDSLLIGGAGNDRFAAGAGHNTLIGGDGNDWFDIGAFFSGAGHYMIRGGEGADRVHYVGRTVVANLEEGTLTGETLSGEAETASLQSIEIFRFDGIGPAHITGSSGNDDIWGGGGDDTIIGAGGNDTMFGNFGNDWYVFNAAPGEANADRINGFTRHEIEGIDKIVLDSSVMTELGTPGQFGAEDDRFYSAAGATGGIEEDHRVIYDTEAGRLYYDPDGSGMAQAQLLGTGFVVLNENLERDVIRASDIVVI